MVNYWQLWLLEIPRGKYSDNIEYYFLIEY